jgi:cytochrome c553
METQYAFRKYRPAIVLACTVLAALFSNPTSADDVAPGDPQLERGRYLAETVALCAHCHSAPNNEIDGRPPLVSNYAGIDCPVWGKDQNPRGKDSPDFVTSKLCEPNITPDPATGIGGWSRADIIRAFRNGLRPDGAPLHPNMWLNLHAVSDEDAEAIASYILTLPPVVHEQPGRGQVLSQRIHTVALASLPPSPAQSPDRSDEAAYGKYLTDIGRCRYCHTPNDGPGRERKGKAFTGGAQYWVGGRYLPGARVIVTPNLTPHPEGIGDLSRADFIALFRARGSGRPATLASNTVMPWVAFAAMTDQDLGAIWAYLQTLPPQPTSQPGDYDF